MADETRGSGEDEALIPTQREDLQKIKDNAPQIASSIMEARKGRERAPGYNYIPGLVLLNDAHDLSNLCGIRAIVDSDQMAAYRENNFHQVIVEKSKALSPTGEKFRLEVQPRRDGKVWIRASTMVGEKFGRRVGQYTARPGTEWAEGKIPVSGIDQDDLGANNSFGWQNLMRDAIKSVAEELGYQE